VLKEIRMALLESDVNFNVVKKLLDQIQTKAIGQEVMTALSPAQQVAKIVHDELVEILGKDTARLKFGSQLPTVILMAGLQGSADHHVGQAGRVAEKRRTPPHCWFPSTSTDPAARQQLKVVAEATKMALYEGTRRGRPTRPQWNALAKEARKEAAKHRMQLSDRRYRRTPAHRRRPDVGNAVAQEAAQPPGNSVCGRRHDRPGRGAFRRRVPQKSFRSPAWCSPKWTATRAAARPFPFAR